MLRIRRALARLLCSNPKSICAASLLHVRAGQVVGLDIGCGANLIYPLLGAAQHGWRFVGTDVTDVAVAGAHANLAANPHLAPLIEVTLPACIPLCIATKLTVTLLILF